MHSALTTLLVSPGVALGVLAATLGTDFWFLCDEEAAPIAPDLALAQLASWFLWWGAGVAAYRTSRCLTTESSSGWRETHAIDVLGLAVSLPSLTVAIWPPCGSGSIASLLVMGFLSCVGP